MTSAAVRIYALVSEPEQPVFQSAAKWLSDAITDAGTPIEFECVFCEDGDAIPSGSDTIILTSLIAQVDSEGSWSDIAQGLEQSLSSLASRFDLSLFVCTVLRHVDKSLDPDIAQRRRIRIRKLNLLAAQLSQATGLQVIDIDRALSDIGARTLETDYRLTDGFGTAAAARFIAVTLLTAGLDAYAAYEVQEAARAAILSQAVPWQSDVRPAHEMVQRDLIQIGRGRRKQRISPIVDAVPENHMAWFIRGVLTRQIGVGEAYQRLKSVIGNRGLRHSMGLVFTGARTLVRTRLKARRAS